LRSAVARTDDRHKLKASGIPDTARTPATTRIAYGDPRRHVVVVGAHLDADDTNPSSSGLTTGEAEGKARIPPSPLRRPSVESSCHPSAAAIKAATPPGYARRVPALTAFAPVGVHGSPTGGSDGEGGISAGFARERSNTKDYMLRECSA